MTTTGRATILVDVLDQDECPNGRSIPVTVEYARDIDRSYGEDADGNRGTTLVTIEPLGVWIDLADLLTLSPWQIERLKQDALATIERLTE